MNKDIDFSKFDKALEELAIATENFVENLEATQKSVQELKSLIISK